MAGVVDDVRVVADSPAGAVSGYPGDSRIASKVMGYWEHGRESVMRTEVPSGRFILIVSLGPRMQVTSPATNRPVLVRSFVAGQHLGPAVTEHEGFQEGVQIDLNPLAARAILAVPLDEL